MPNNTFSRTTIIGIVSSLFFSLLLILSPTTNAAVTIKPAAKSSINAQKLPAVNIRRVTTIEARLSQTARRQGTVNAGSGNYWQCRGSVCTLNKRWSNATALNQCRRLSRLLGRMRSFKNRGNTRQQLNPSSIRQCNVGVRSRRANPQRRGLPSAQQAAREIRSAAAQNATNGIIRSITSYDPSQQCVTAGLSSGKSIVVIRGTNFGSSSRGKKLTLVSAVRHTVLNDLTIRNWSNNRIVASVPRFSRGVRIPRRLAVAIRNSRNRWVSNYSRPINLCYTNTIISGKISFNNCAANLRNIKVKFKPQSGRLRSARVSKVPGNDFVFQYNITLYNKSTRDIYEVIPELSGISCPTGRWLPSNKMVRAGYFVRGKTFDLSYGVKVKTISIPLRVLSNQMRDTVKGFKMRINNYNRATKGKKDNDSFVTIPDGLGGGQRVINILPVVSGPRTYYVNDISLKRLAIAPAPNQGLKLRFIFETNGKEFIGHCKDDAGCIAGTPSVEMDLNAEVIIPFERYVGGSGTSISYNKVIVSLNANIQAGGICRAIDVCNLFTEYKRKIKTQISKAFTDVLNSRKMRDDVAAAIRTNLGSINIGRIYSVKVNRNKLVIEYLPVR